MNLSERPLEQRVALVTGASRGIGSVTARALARAGAAVVLAARTGSALAGLAEEIVAGGGHAVAVPTDLSDPDAVRRLVARTVDVHGRLDAAVNAAAAEHPPPTPLAELSVADYDAALAVTLRGTFLAMKYQIPAMLVAGGGSIVNIASTAALRPVGGLAGYVSAKAGLVGLTRTAALDYAARGIRVNALAPGPVLTEQLERAGGRARTLAAAAVPVGRLATPQEVAAAAVWLCSDASSFTTGTTLTVDGGMLAGMSPFAGERSGRSSPEPGGCSDD
jgi:NAD(P)-dependent dehydrogenase (short-subunit alcohol dehydrogenase family)